MQDSTPMLVFVGHVNSASMGRESFQEIDQRAFFGSVAKAVLATEDVDAIPALTADAVRLATEGRPGPVIVQIPRDVSSSDTDAAVLQPVARSDRAPQAQLIERAAAMISTAKRPLVIAGEMISNQDASQALTEFADARRMMSLPASRRDG